jgi:hypothetical protein
VPDEDADNDFLLTDNSEEDFGDEVPDEDADDNFLQKQEKHTNLHL